MQDSIIHIICMSTLVKIELEIHKILCWVICFRWCFLHNFGYSVQCSTQLSLIDMFS